MLQLDYAQKEAIGLTFILDRLIPDSPYGTEARKQIAPFGKERRAAIDECFDNMEKIMTFAAQEKVALAEIRRQLMQLKNIRGIIKKCEQAALHEVELFEVKSFLLTFERLFNLLQVANEKLNLAGIHFQSMKAALDILDPEGKRIAPFSIDEIHDPALGEIRRQKLRIERKLETEVAMKERSRLVAEETAAEMRIMKMLSEKLRAYVQIFEANMDQIGKLDLIITKALLALEYGATRPKISASPTVTLRDMANPYIEDALTTRGEHLTRTSITLTDGVTMITGANMGGKSVAIKTMVLNVLLCQMGFFVFAGGAEIPLFDGVTLISGDLQDISQGLSTFGAEIMRFHEIVESLKTDFVFVALDEFARGTNPEEGAAIVRAVASYLAETSAISVMTTHYDRVVSPKFKHYQVVGLKFADIDQIRKQGKADIKNIAKYMDYTLVPADKKTSPPRDALNICKLIELDADVLARIEAEYQNNLKHQ